MIECAGFNFIVFALRDEERIRRVAHLKAGVVAQLVEHHNGIVGVRGSNPLGSTSFDWNRIAAMGLLTNPLGDLAKRPCRSPIRGACRRRFTDVQRSRMEADCDGRGTTDER